MTAGFGKTILNSGLRLGRRFGRRNSHAKPLRRVGFNRFSAEEIIDHLNQLTGVQLDFSRALSAPMAAASCDSLVMWALERMITGVSLRREWNGCI